MDGLFLLLSEELDSLSLNSLIPLHGWLAYRDSDKSRFARPQVPVPGLICSLEGTGFGVRNSNFPRTGLVFSHYLTDITASLRSFTPSYPQRNTSN